MGKAWRCKERKELLLDWQSIKLHEQEVIALILCKEGGREWRRTEKKGKARKTLDSSKTIAS